MDEVTGEVARVALPQGSIAWAQGQRKGIGGEMVSQWYYIPPPYDQKEPISLNAPPIGAKNTDSASPYETIQMIGRSGATVPKRIAIDLGFTDIFILNGKQIEFTDERGLKTDVGTRMESPTKGMSINEAEGAGWADADIKDYLKKEQSVSRPAFKKKKPARRKQRRTDGFSEITGIQSRKEMYG